ncbi:hypothetical protein QBC38DRAFT_483778 [Podospora fimiseda]|uniref:U1-C C2H2-type zinc finger domain-containing protein n=1 Tax=Podospora fimiseda TaxID=252190 RepID=A0AAN7BKV2_9PEZI|nr:hypothetical protein QBC38DRAFT_483778 [Podospora fimiseda]
MSEYWKSTPKYWCKHCSVYVRDTKLERTNHEATGRHQGAIKRSLRDLHRTAEQADREKERAKREVDRLNGVVSSSSGSSSKAHAARYSTTATIQPKEPTQAERQRQLEQLAELGVAIPDELRKDMAMVGEWSVTSTRIIDDDAGGEEKGEQKDLAGRAVGVKRTREITEEEKEREEALNGLFNQNKKRRWGVGSRTMPEGEEDEELDALLSGGLVVKKMEEEPVDGESVKKEGDGEFIKKEVEGEPVKEEDGGDQQVKKEESQNEAAALDSIPELKTTEGAPLKVKMEPGVEGGDGPIDIPSVLVDSGAPVAVFKSRRPKNVRKK